MIIVGTRATGGDFSAQFTCLGTSFTPRSGDQARKPTSRYGEDVGQSSGRRSRKVA
jgi:hypothetical protein